MSGSKLALWHRAYVRWCDHERDGHKVREWVWRRITEGLLWVFWGSR